MLIFPVFARTGFLFAVFAALGALLAVPAQAETPAVDCKGTLEKAKSALNTNLLLVQESKHPDPAAFEKAFGALVDSLVTQKCEAELINLVDFVELQKQKHEASQTPYAPSGK